MFSNCLKSSHRMLDDPPETLIWISVHVKVVIPPSRYNNLIQHYNFKISNQAHTSNREIGCGPKLSSSTEVSAFASSCISIATAQCAILKNTDGHQDVQT